MKKVLLLSILITVLTLSACAPSTPTSMAISATPTPGSMIAANPEAAHMMEPITAPSVEPATETRGGQPLDHRIEDGVKVFELTTKAVQWEIVDGVAVTAITYNGTVPGPMIRVTEGDQVRVIVRNELPDPTTIHWHGVEVPNAMDGVPGVTQDPIQPGETFTYEFVAKPAGTLMCHSHFEGDAGGVTHAISDLAGIRLGFRDTNRWLVSLTNNSLPADFYAGDALRSFNSIARFITGLLAGLGSAWFAFPYVVRDR